MKNQEYTDFSKIINNQQKALEIVRNNDHLVYYEHEGIKIPRVSKILDTTIGNRGLVDWAGRVGYRRMTAIRESALTVGGIVHEMIEYDLNHGYDKEINFSDYNLTDKDIRNLVCSYNNYKRWKDNLLDAGNRINAIIGTEVPVSCPWYGGTVDAIMIINGATYIIDFKTSKQISKEYLLQTAAYAWIVNNGYCSICNHVDGVGILRFDKRYESVYEEYFLNYHNPYQHEFLIQYTRTFWALVNSFYNLAYSGYILSNTLEDEKYQISNLEVV